MKAKSALIASISTVGIACTANAQDFTSPGGVFVDRIGTFTVDLVIGASGTIADLDVTTNWASHSWMGDLHVTLTHVDTGTTAAVFEDVGPGTGSSSDLVGAYRFDDESTNSFVAAAASNPVPTGTYFAVNAAEAQSFLSVFDGESISGTWRLTMTDDYPASATGTLTNFTLHMTVPAPGALGLLGAAGLAGLGRRRSRR
jgi:hypothetical protein